jgi:hypothetical protein
MGKEECGVGGEHLRDCDDGLPVRPLRSGGKISRASLYRSAVISLIM